MANAANTRRKNQWVTAIVDSWPYSVQEIERAVYSAGRVAHRVMVVLPDIISPYDVGDFPGMPAEIHRVPFWGNFATLRNRVMRGISTPWALLLLGNEEFLSADAERFLSALEPGAVKSFRLIVATGARGQILAEPIRVVPVSRQIQYAGRIWPQVGGSLIEFGYPIESLNAHVYRLQDLSSTAKATARLRSVLGKLASPRNWQAQLALAVLLWAEHRYADSRSRLDSLPRTMPDAEQHMVDGLSALLWLDRGQPKKALARVQEGLARHSDRADLWVIAGDAWAAQGRFAEAADAYRRALNGEELLLPYMEPGYATYTAQLKLARAEIATMRVSQGVARLLAILEDYPGYRPAWQEVLSHLRSMPPDQVFADMITVVAPSKIRQFFSCLTYPTADELRMQEWLVTRDI